MYQALAYRKLGLSGDGHDIGTLRYIDLPEDALYSICARRLNTVDKTLYEERPPWPQSADEGFLQADRAWCRRVRKNYFLLYPQWLYMLKNRSYKPEGWKAWNVLYEERRKAIVECHFKYDLDEGGKYEPTFAGWKRYLKHASPIFYDFLQKQIPVHLPRDKLLNAYIVAASQSGKTELLKLFAYSIITRGKEALVVIEPAGDASRQVARWKECGDRLIFVDLSLDLGMTPTINPFEIYGVRVDDTSPEARAVKTVIAQQLLTAFQEVLATGEGADLSKNMQSVLMQCLMVLLDYPGATIRDLHRFMDSDRNADLVAFAQSRQHYEDVRDFFTFSFHKRNLEQTKTAIHTKLQDLFSSGQFAKLTCARSTIMLEEAIEQRKVIVFNLATGSVGEREGTAFGRLIVAKLQGIAVRREKHGTRAPTRVIIDEVHNYTTKSMEKIITEAAKYQLFLTMAQQQIGQGMTSEMKNAVLNASAQIAGRNSPSFYSSVASMLRVDAEDIAGLDRGEFIIHLSGVKPFKFRIHTHLLGWSNSMSEKEWNHVKADQLERYYRPTTSPVPVAEILPPAGPPAQKKGKTTVRVGVAVEVSQEPTAPQKPLPHDPFNIDRV